MLKRHEQAPDRPIVVVMTGTDLHPEGAPSMDPRALPALECARRIVVLHAGAVAVLPAGFRAKTRVILQSAVPPRTIIPSVDDAIAICVVGHLRPVKDPFRAAEAAARLPFDSRVRILQIGAALDDSMRDRALAEMRTNARYAWIGELSWEKARARMAGCAAMLLTSFSEGGASVIGEAAVCGIPILSTRIDAAESQLGADHPGLFDVGDTAALTRLLSRFERDPEFRSDLAARSRRAAPQFAPEREAAAIAALMDEVFLGD